MDSTELLEIINPVTREKIIIRVKAVIALRAKSDAAYMARLTQKVLAGENGKLPKPQELVPLTLTEGSEEYTLYVSPPDFNRAYEDTLFAAQLLQDHKDAVNRQASHSLSANFAPNHDSMLDESKSMILEVEDDITGKFYTLRVSPAEHEQARKDYRFARVLLANYKLNLGEATTSTAADEKSPTTNELIDDPSYDDDDFEEIEKESTLKRKSSNSSSLWSFNQTQLLLCSYKQYADKLDDGSMTSRAFWTKIKELLREKGHSFTLKQCSTKMETLKRAYKRIKEHNATSGNDRKTCDHYELLDELFHKKPWIKPLSTTGSNLPMSDMDECDEIHKTQRQKTGGAMSRAELLRENLEMKRKSEEDKRMYREKKLKLLTDLSDSLKRK